VVKSCPSDDVVAVCRGTSCQEGLNVASCGDANFCRAKQDGRFCDAGYLKTCADNLQTDLLYCGGVCEDRFQSGECGTANFCVAKTVGDYCDGQILKRCESGDVKTMYYCEGGCMTWYTGAAGCGTPDGSGLSSGARSSSTALAALPLLGLAM